MGLFEHSAPNVAVRASTFGGGWIWPLDMAGAQALREFFGEGEPAECSPIGRKAYIVDPQEERFLVEHLRACNCEWEIG